MTSPLIASIEALQAYQRASYHQRLNIMVEYFEKSLPIVIEEMMKKIEEDER
jgi:hypothetical protein